MIAKQLMYLADALSAGIVLGARVPIALTSRGDDLRSWLASATLVQLVAHMYRHQAAAGAAGTDERGGRSRPVCRPAPMGRRAPGCARSRRRGALFRSCPRRLPSAGASSSTSLHRAPSDSIFVPRALRHSQAVTVDGQGQWVAAVAK